MVAANFPASLALVLQSEGGNDDDPQDHGGRTSRGITQREYDAWRTSQGLPTQDVWTASQDDIETIYHDNYWEPYCDDMPIGLDYVYFNNCVLAGPRRATILLQQALGVTADGMVGPMTLAAVASRDPASAIRAYSAAATTWYHSLNQPRFTKGWLNRVAFVENNALSMVSPALAFASPPAKKGMITMNAEQSKALVRWLIATFGPILIAHGYANGTQLEMWGGVLTSAIPLIWGMFTHTDTNAVAVVDTLAKNPDSPVQAIIVNNTPAGHDLAMKMPGNTTVVDGSAQEQIAVLRAGAGKTR